MVEYRLCFSCFFLAGIELVVCSISVQDALPNYSPSCRGQKGEDLRPTESADIEIQLANATCFSGKAFPLRFSMADKKDSFGFIASLAHK